MPTHQTPLIAPAKHELSQWHPAPIEKNPAALYLLSLRSINSREVMRRVMKGIALVLGFDEIEAIQWEKLRHTHVQFIINEAIARDLKPSSINLQLSALKGIAKQAWLNYQMPADAYQRIKEVKGASGQRIAAGRALRRNEVKGLFDSCLHDENTLAGCRDAAILALLVGCGFRRSEIVGINIGHYDRHQKLVKVLGKGNKERENAIPAQLVPLVDNWLEHRACKDPKSPLFVRFFKGQKQSSQRMTAQAVYYLLEKRSAAQHMQTFTPHDLRRTFATSLFDQGESIRTVQLALGHQNIETTKIYDKRGEQRKNEVLRNLAVF